MNIQKNIKLQIKNLKKKIYELNKKIDIISLENNEILKECKKIGSFVDMIINFYEGICKTLQVLINYCKNSIDKLIEPFKKD
jgi:hypothetical protein